MKERQEGDTVVYTPENGRDGVMLTRTPLRNFVRRMVFPIALGLGRLVVTARSRDAARKFMKRRGLTVNIE